MHIEHMVCNPVFVVTDASAGSSTAAAASCPSTSTTRNSYPAPGFLRKTESCTDSGLTVMNPFRLGRLPVWGGPTTLISLCVNSAAARSRWGLAMPGAWGIKACRYSQ